VGPTHLKGTQSLRELASKLRRVFPGSVENLSAMEGRSTYTNVDAASHGDGFRVVRSGALIRGEHGGIGKTDS
jgi:hypothetical protein